MELPPTPLDIIPRVNLWSIVKRGVPKNGNQYSGDVDLYKEFIKSTANIVTVEVKR